MDNIFRLFFNILTSKNQYLIYDLLTHFTLLNLTLGIEKNQNIISLIMQMRRK